MRTDHIQQEEGRAPIRLCLLLKCLGFRGVAEISEVPDERIVRRNKRGLLFRYVKHDNAGSQIRRRIIMVACFQN